MSKYNNNTEIYFVWVKVSLFVKTLWFHSSASNSEPLSTLHLNCVWSVIGCSRCQLLITVTLYVPYYPIIYLNWILAMIIWSHPICLFPLRIDQGLSWCFKVFIFCIPFLFSLLLNALHSHMHVLIIFVLYSMIRICASCIFRTCLCITVLVLMAPSP